jgi:ATP-dependent Lon protease
MNKRKPDDEFAKIDLSYFATDGREVVVYCPESKDARATQQPTRKGLDGLAEVADQQARAVDGQPRADRPELAAPLR